jgi:hypothetical protein
MCWHCKCKILLNKRGSSGEVSDKESSGMIEDKKSEYER